MAKDPAMLWYWGDWHSGTSLLSRFLKGCYIDILHAQFNNGHLSIEEIKTCLGSDFGQSWPTLQKKFKQDENGLFFNERLDLEKKRRADFNESRRQSRLGKKKTYDATYEKRTSPRTENADEDENKKEIGSEKVKHIANDVWKDQHWKDSMCIGLNIKHEDLKMWLAQFNASVSGDSIADFDKSKYKKLCRGWIVKQQQKGVKVDSSSKLVSSGAPPLKTL